MSRSKRLDFLDAFTASVSHATEERRSEQTKEKLNVKKEALGKERGAIPLLSLSLSRPECVLWADYSCGQWGIL